MSAESINNGEKTRLLTFYLTDELYAIEIINIKEIIAYTKPTKIPKTPDFLVGVINLRGNIIPVADLRARFMMPKNEDSSNGAIVITTLKGVNLGFVVDNVEEVLPTESSMYSDTPKFNTSIDSDYIKSMVRYEESVIMLLNLDSLFSDKDLENLEGL
ncbi:MAG: chemotaxis protein CheW [Campylobacterales bacterium]